VVVDFIDIHKDRFGVVPICRVLTEHGVGIAPSSYYAFKTRPPSSRQLSDESTLVEIVRVYEGPGRSRYGARKVWRQLRAEDAGIARCTIERLMACAGLFGVHRGAKRRTTISDPAAMRPPDLVDRAFRADRPNELWVVDFTYVSTWQQTAYTALCLDVYSRRIVGWRCASSMPTALPLDALEMALDLRARRDQDIRGLVHHSDAGSQYTSIVYTERLADAGALASIGSVGDSYDNALAESLIGLYKTECVHFDAPWRTVEELELATLVWVDWYNTTRIHSSIGYKTPVAYEQAYWQQHLKKEKGKQTV
jgi:putative transposase